MGVKILSLYDGMACGMIAMQLAGVEVESYDAYEIDKYAIKTAQHNFPMIKEHGDVFDADFTQYEGVDFGIGGSPCTHWSIAQTKNRETTVNRDSKGNVLLHQSGIGVELFSQFLRMLSEAKPKFFIYENNKSMSKEIRTAITECFGFEPTEINSALVSAQNRQRLYWVGKRNANGTYSKVNVEQPADRGILLKDVLDNVVAWREKAYTIDANYYKATDGTDPFGGHQSNNRMMAAEPVRGIVNDTKSRTLTANYWKTNVRDAFVDCAGGRTMVAEPINTDANGKAFCVTSRYYKGFGNNPGKCLEKHRDSMVAEPVSYCTDKNMEHLMRNFGSKGKIVDEKSKTPTLMAAAGMGGGNHIYYADSIAEPGIKHLGSLYGQHSRWGVFDEEGKAPTLTASAGMGGGHLPMVSEPINGYIVEYDDDGKPIKVIGKDGKEITIYEVRDGKITIKGKQYPIKLKDGYYIIRKLTVSECKRLQTVPEWYEFPVSNSQAYKMLGNGWTCEVICHLINSCFKSTDVLPGQIGLWGGVDG